MFVGLSYIEHARNLPLSPSTSVASAHPPSLHPHLALQPVRHWWLLCKHPPPPLLYTSHPGVGEFSAISTTTTQPLHYAPCRPIVSTTTTPLLFETPAASVPNSRCAFAPHVPHTHHPSTLCTRGSPTSWHRWLWWPPIQRAPKLLIGPPVLHGTVSLHSFSILVVIFLKKN